MQEDAFYSPKKIIQWALNYTMDITYDYEIKARTTIKTHTIRSKGQEAGLVKLVPTSKTASKTQDGCKSGVASMKHSHLKKFPDISRDKLL